MGDLDKYDRETLFLAFWLQEKIYTEGLEGIHYMEKAQIWAERNAADITADRISRQLRRL
jgi:hypothetical protein